MLDPQAVARALAPLGTPAAHVLANWPIIAGALERAGINDRATEIACAATVVVETGSFTPIEEYGDWQYFLNEFHSAYEAQYHGRGFCQLSWSNNYLRYGQELAVDLIGNPALALQPDIAARILALYFQEHGIPAAANAGDWISVREAVNGGLNGWSTFIEAVNALLPLPDGPPLVAVTRVAVAGALKQEPNNTSRAAIGPAHEKVILSVGTVITFEPCPTPGEWYGKKTTPHYAHCKVQNSEEHGWYLREHLSTSFQAAASEPTPAPASASAQ